MALKRATFPDIASTICLGLLGEALSPQGSLPLGGALSPQGSPPLGGALSPQGSIPLGGALSLQGSPPLGGVLSPQKKQRTIILPVIGNGNRTEWSPIRSVIIRVIKEIGRPRSGSPICLITSMITDRIGRHEVLLRINHNINNICDIIGYFLNQNRGGGGGGGGPRLQ